MDRLWKLSRFPRALTIQVLVLNTAISMEIGRATYDSITDEEALESFKLLSRLEGIIPALESSHAIALTQKVAKELGADKSIIVCLSGRGDKDVAQVKERLKQEAKEGK